MNPAFYVEKQVFRHEENSACGPLKVTFPGNEFPKTLKYNFFKNQSSKSLPSGDGRLDMIFEKRRELRYFFNRLSRTQSEPGFFTVTLRKASA